MDRRSWLWRRKPSDKSSGETESLGSGSGSMSSPSERFSDEQQVYPIQNVQSPDVTSKHESDTSDSVKILSEKLSAAVATVNEKEELVKQHAKVAEEAVNGWERAEDEMNAMKQELDAATAKNSTLEDKVAHLDGALKECLRQLRKLREEQQDERIQEPENSELQTQLADLGLKLATSEKENASLKLELRSQLEVLEVRTLERDLSTKRAETASKQHLESIKKVAKLEAECRRLKAVSRKGNSVNDHKSVDENGLSTPSRDVGLMDDFLEMEKLATSIVEGGESGNERKSPRTGLEERIEVVEAEKAELGMTLSQCQNQLNFSQAQLRDANEKICVLRDELDLASELRQAIELELDDANVRREEAEAKLKSAENENKIMAFKVAKLEGELFKTKNDLSLTTVSKESSESELKAARDRVNSLIANIVSLENEVEKERRLSKELEGKCRELEAEGCRLKCEVERWLSELNSANDLNEAMKREVEIVNTKKEEVEKQLEVVQDEARSLFARVSSLESEMEKEKTLSREFSSKCKKLEEEISEVKLKADVGFVTVSKEELNRQQEKELEVAASKLAACQKTITSLGNQLKSLTTLEDFFSDPYKHLEISYMDSQLLLN